MNTTLTLQSNRRPIYKTSGNPIGENTENVAFNVPVRAFRVLCDAVRGQNRSAKIRQWIADGMMRENTWSGLAFRAACKLSASFASIFTPNLAPEEKAAVFLAEVEGIKVAIKQPENQTGGAVLIEDLTALGPDGEYEPKK